MYKNKMLIYGIALVENGKVVNCSGHSYDLETKERLFYDGGLGKYDNFDLLRRLIIGPEKYIELNPEKVEKPRQLFDFSVRCNVCGRALTYKESVFCQENGLMPTCYQCQYSRN